MLSPISLLPFLNLSLNRTNDLRKSFVEAPCPFTGQIYPPPTNINHSPIWQDAVATLNEALSSSPSLELNVSSYGIKIVSLHEHSTIFEHYNKAPDHRHGKTGKTPIDGDTIFRIASTSKMLTVYALLIKCGFQCFEHPISRYVPELANFISTDSTEHVDWDEVTVGALASQLSGIGRDYAIGDLTASLGTIPPSAIGLPDYADIDPTDIVKCGANNFYKPCSRKESLELMLKSAPSFPTWYTPAYSNMAFQLIGYVLEDITGQAYAEVMAETVFKPLNMSHTSAMFPNDPSEAVTLPGDLSFKFDIGDETPAGGIYASTNDLAAHALAVLNSTHLSPSMTRHWMKPHSYTADDFLSFGSPWEILHLPGISEHHRIDIYLKAGDLPPYHTFYSIIPQLNVALIVNAATFDPASAASPIAALVLQHILNPLFEVAKTQAISKFTGTFIDDRPDVNSSITIATDEEIGLIISHWVSNSTDMIALGRELLGITHPVRLFPTTLTSMVGADGIEKIAFRATLMNARSPCLTWGPVDAVRYGGKAIDLVKFEVEDGRAMAVLLPAYRARLSRVDDDKEQEKEQRLNVQP